MSYQVISTLDCWRWAWESSLNNIDILIKIWTCPIFLLHWRNFSFFLNGYQSNSSDSIIFWHSRSFSSVWGCVTIPQVYTYIFIGMNSSSDASIPSFLRGLFGSSYIWIPNFRHWFGFISDFSIPFPNHNPCPNSSITTSNESSVKEVTHVHLGIFICFAYSGSNGDTVHSSEVNEIGQKLAPKQWVSSWLSISLANALQITLSWFLFTLIIIRW